jgi:hypothetical protein
VHDSAKADVPVGFCEGCECFFGFVTLFSVDACVGVGVIFGHALSPVRLCCGFCPLMVTFNKKL